MRIAHVLLVGFLYYAGALTLAAQEKERFSFEKLMSKEDQKRTGVSRLTPTERRALEEWMYQWTVKAVRFASRSGQERNTQSVPRARGTCLQTGSGHWVSKTIEGGKYVELEDGSLWEISALDRINSMLWLVTENIAIVASQNPIYPCRMINKDSEDTAEAKRIN